MPDTRTNTTPNARGTPPITARSIADAARRLYADAPAVHRLMQVYRSSICPLERVLEQIPSGSRVLDVGCGSGVVLGASADAGILGRDPERPSIGFDVSGPAIATANLMAGKLNASDWLRFQRMDADAPWPGSDEAAGNGRGFDVVTIVDVMHHVTPAARQGVIQRAAAALRPGGRLVYKDMVPTGWRAWMNRAHDLVMARQWITYTPAEVVEHWATAAGLERIEASDDVRLWYGHQLRVFAKPMKT